MTDHERLADQNRNSKGAVSDNAEAALEPWVVHLLACPLDRGAVRLDGSELACDRCGRRYPVRSGIPNMLPDQSISEQKF